MPNTIATQVLFDDAVSSLIKYTIVGDGSGEVTGGVLYDASSYIGAPAKPKIRTIDYSMVGCSAKLNWDATTDVFIMGLPADYAYKFNFEQFGQERFKALPNNSGAGVTGDILITTSGLGLTDTVTIIMEIVK